jgi:thiol:disulfide interchange protein DsbA
MTHILRIAICFLGLLSASTATLAAAPAAQFREGKHYTVLKRPQPSQAEPGKVEVMEVFSYGCPACNRVLPSMERLQASLPRNAQMVFVHASWNKAESWPMFQRAYATAKSLGIADANHAAMFNAVWGPNAPLAVVDSRTRQLKPRQPTIEDVAKFYASRKVCTEAQFLAAARSFAVETRIRKFESLVKGYDVGGTPCVIVGGHYRVELEALKSDDELDALVRMLVQKSAA